LLSTVIVKLCEMLKELQIYQENVSWMKILCKLLILLWNFGGTFVMVFPQSHRDRRPCFHVYFCYCVHSYFVCSL